MAPSSVHTFRVLDSCTWGHAPDPRSACGWAEQAKGSTRTRPFLSDARLPNKNILLRFCLRALLTPLPWVMTESKVIWSFQTSHRILCWSITSMTSCWLDIMSKKHDRPLNTYSPVGETCNLWRFTDNGKVHGPKPFQFRTTDLPYFLGGTEFNVVQGQV